MERAAFEKLVADVLDALPARFRRMVQNVVVAVEDGPPEEDSRGERDPDDLLMGVFDGMPRTEESFFHAPDGPARIVLYQANIEEYARAAAEEEDRPVDEIIREEVRLTVLHELGHYFGLNEDELAGV